MCHSCLWNNNRMIKAKVQLLSWAFMFNIKVISHPRKIPIAMYTKLIFCIVCEFFWITHGSHQTFLVFLIFSKKRRGKIPLCVSVSDIQCWWGWLCAVLGDDDDHDMKSECECECKREYSKQTMGRKQISWNIFESCFIYGWRKRKREREEEKWVWNEEV